jgi:hypothetical protein
MSQMVDRLVKKWEDQCDETTTTATTATGIVRNIQVDLGNITAIRFHLLRWTKILTFEQLRVR